MLQELCESQAIYRMSGKISEAYFTLALHTLPGMSIFGGGVGRKHNIIGNREDAFN